jgi:NDP-sugar pyrophosphorylase family protein
MKSKDIFINKSSIAYGLIESFDYPFEVLDKINEFIMKIGKSLDNNFVCINDNIWIHKSAKIDDSAYIIGPAIIDEGANIRHSAFIRENVIIGKNCVVGNSCEIKNSILFDEVQVPHFNYVGDSILGYKSHLGAGVILSNVRSDKKNIVINKEYETNLRKVGSFLGDYVEVGCNSVLNPGCIIMNNTSIYPLTSVRGIIPENSIVKSMDNIVLKENRD